jgi:hypothetical protein
MTNVNAFRPTLNPLEGRSLMSATLAALPAEPAPLRYELENVFVSSAQPAPATADHKETIEIHSWSFGASNPSASGHHTNVDRFLHAHGGPGRTDDAGFVVVGEITAEPGESSKGITVRKQHNDENPAEGFRRVFGELNGDAAATGKEIEIPSWSLAVPVDPTAGR